MDLAVVIVSFNVRELLAACLDSVLADLAAAGLETKVWVVDNASADGSADMVRQRFPQVELIASERNLGFAAGNNLALKAMGFGQGGLAVPRHVLLLNPDTEILRSAQNDIGALAAMVGFLDSNEQAGACGAALVYPDGSFQHSAFAFPTLWQIFFDFFPLHGRLLDSRLNGRYPRSLYQAGRPFPVDHPLGAALMARSAAISQVGLMDERFFIYCEEIDWCMRMKKSGQAIYCVPGAVIVHHGGQSTGQFRQEMFVALWRSRYLLFAKHYSRAFRGLARRLVHLGLRAEMRRSQESAARGEIAAEELERRLAAYREVWGLGAG
jgi:N-acetylglucosaminyl-diphospho-decaprenol L-rhamnosyltransferase